MKKIKNEKKNLPLCRLPVQQLSWYVTCFALITNILLGLYESSNKLKILANVLWNV